MQEQVRLEANDGQSAVETTRWPNQVLEPVEEWLRWNSYSQ